MHTRHSLTGSALIATCCLAFSQAAAQMLSDSEKRERLERQTELLQRQLNALQDEIAQMKNKAAKVEAVLPVSVAATPGQ
jgi:chaperonin cofactor prefoldin